MPNHIRVEVYFNFELPKKDPDDQKFTDCAIACGAAFLVSDDGDFKEVADLPSPAIKIISAKTFKDVFQME